MVAQCDVYAVNAIEHWFDDEYAVEMSFWLVLLLNTDDMIGAIMSLTFVSYCWLVAVTKLDDDDDCCAIVPPFASFINLDAINCRNGLRLARGSCSSLANETAAANDDNGGGGGVVCVVDGRCN